MPNVVNKSRERAHKEYTKRKNMKTGKHPASYGGSYIHRAFAMVKHRKRLSAPSRKGE